MEQVLTKEMTIASIFSTFPDKSQKLSQEITNFGLHCVGCSAATWETIEAGMLSHGKTPQDIENLITRLNTIIQEQSTPSTISLTPRAAEKYLKLLEEEGKAGWGLRLDDRLSGCNGYEFIVDYSEAPSEKDLVFESQGIAIHIKKSKLQNLLGSEIDWIEGLQGAGFKVSNPNVKSSCGCGSSHGY